MFQQVKEQVDILQLVADLFNVELEECGDNTFQLEDKTCPYCGHSDCFKIKSDENDRVNDFAHCFSCGTHLDVVGVYASVDLSTSMALPRSQWKKPGEACRELASRFEIELKRDYSPVQEVMDLAARYYHMQLLDPDAATQEFLRKQTPLQYQENVRMHSKDVLEKLQIGWSDGKLVDFLESVGISEEIMLESGLVRNIRGKLRDFLPAKTFIYPHLVKGRVSHFTFKDPLKKLDYQLPNKHSLNNHMFYNQDSASKYDTVLVVEGENDVASVVDSKVEVGVIGTIGSISKKQLEWINLNLADKRVITIYDNDDAGNDYRERTAKSCGKALTFLSQIILEKDGPKDIDEILSQGGDLTLLLSDAENFLHKEKGSSGADRSGSGEGGEDIGDCNLGDETANFGISVKHGRYFKTKYKEGQPIEMPITNFLMELRYVYIREDQRNREIIIVKYNGERSDPVIVNSETKVSLKTFKTLIANAIDATFYGSEADLADLWEYLFNSSQPKIVYLPEVVGTLPDSLGGGWLLGNVYLSRTGVRVQPDDNGVFWISGGLGIKPVSIDSTAISGNGGDLKRVPQLVLPFGDDVGQANLEMQELEGEFLRQLAKNLGDPGLATLMISWMKACAFSNSIYKAKGFFPFLFFFGRNGKGKTIIAKWMLSLYDMREKSYTQSSQLKSGVGFSRLLNYYASLPAMVDEIRADKETEENYGMYRAWYNREGRVMGTRDSNSSIRIQSVRSCIMFSGEDMFDDPATRERCIQVEIKNKGRELVESYRWICDHEPMLPMLGYKWIRESLEIDMQTLVHRIETLNKELVANGVSPRIAYNYSVVGIFGEEMADRHLKAIYPDFSWSSYLAGYSTVDFEDQREQSTLMKFLDRVEGVQAEEHSILTCEHIRVDGKYLYIWFAEVFRLVQARDRDNSFTNKAVLRHMKEEPYFVADDRKEMGLQNTRRRVVVLDLSLDSVPASLQNIAKNADGDSGLN